MNLRRLCPAAGLAASYLSLIAGLVFATGCGQSALSGNGGADTDGGDPPANADAGADGPITIGSVDLSQAPATLGITCDGVSTLAFVMPCRIGENLTRRGGVGLHIVECTLADSDPPTVVWSFSLPLLALQQNPNAVLHFPSDVPTIEPPVEFPPVKWQEKSAHISDVTGVLTVSRVDPAARAFIGSFAGTVNWNVSGLSPVTCQVNGPFWGAPGNFF